MTVIQRFNSALDVSTHFHVLVGAADRGGLERMARYLARPPIATDRLTEREDGRLELRLKRPWRDGTKAFLFTPHELIERLVAQIPRPRAHLTRYHGALAPAFAARSQIVPRAEEAERKDRPVTTSGDSDGKNGRGPRRSLQHPFSGGAGRVIRMRLRGVQGGPSPVGRSSTRPPRGRSCRPTVRAGQLHCGSAPGGEDDDREIGVEGRRERKSATALSPVVSC